LGGAQEAQEEDPMAGSVFFYAPPTGSAVTGLAHILIALVRFRT
jgi:hypothetical protein